MVESLKTIHQWSWDGKIQIGGWKILFLLISFHGAGSHSRSYHNHLMPMSTSSLTNALTLANFQTSDIHTTSAFNTQIPSDLQTHPSLISQILALVCPQLIVYDLPWYNPPFTHSLSKCTITDRTIGLDEKKTKVTLESILEVIVIG